MSYDNYYRLLESEYVNDDDEIRFSHPDSRGHFVQSDQDFFTVQHRGGSACSVADRPASSPAFYPDLEWYLPPPNPVHRSGTEGENDAKTRIDAWISRLDHLILDRPMNDVAKMTSSRTTLTSSSSSTKTEVGDDEEREAEAASPCHPSADEFTRATDQRRDYFLVSPGPLSLTVYRGAARNADVETRLPVEYQTGTVCSNIDEAYEILNTRYKLEDIAVDRKPIITFSKWNVSQIVRGPHEQSPIWNSSLQRRRYDRPDSIVFRELDKEINRRNKELEQIVEKKTELCRRFCSSQNSPTSPPSPTSSPVSSQTPIACSSASPYLLSSSSSPSLPPYSSCRLSPPVREPSSQTQNAFAGSPGHQILRCHGTSLETDPASSSHPPVATTTKVVEEEKEEEEVSHDPPPAAEASGPGVGFGLIRRMVKSFWSIFVGGDEGGCHGDAKNSREALKGDEKPESGQKKDPTPGKPSTFYR